MKQNPIRSLVLLLKLDATNLITRLQDRKSEAIKEFSLKRTRDHFGPLFYSRYWSVEAKDLQQCSSDLLLMLDKFYGQVDEMKWYMDHTQDMTSAFADKVELYIKNLKKIFETLDLYFDAELDTYNPPEESLGPLEES